MKRWRKWLIPAFLQRLDNWLLVNKPNIWRMRVHFVAFYALSASILLLLAGLLIPISPTNPTVDPIIPITLLNESYFFVSFPVALIALISWWYNLYLYPSIRPTLKTTLSDVIFYSVGLLLLLGVFPVSYRLGNILQTAYGLMDYEDVKKIQQKNYYAYGFCLPDEPLLSLDSINIEELLIEGKLRFDSLIRLEDERLSEGQYVETSSLYPYKWYQSDQSDLSYQSGRPYPDLSDYWSYLSDRSYQSGSISYPPNLSNLSDRPYQSDRTYLSDRSYVSDILRNLSNHRLDRTYLSDNIHALFANYHYSYSNKYYDKYRIPTKIDTIAFEDITFYLPRHVYQLEDLTRSVIHARSFVSKGFIWIYFLQIIPFCLVLTLIALGVPFLSVKRFFVALGVVILYFLFLKTVYTNDIIGVVLLAIAPVLLFLSLILGAAIPFARYKTNYFPDLFFHLNWIALLVVGFVAFLSLSDVMFGEVDFIIFLSICLILSTIFAILYPSVHYLPRRR